MILRLNCTRHATPIDETRMTQNPAPMHPADRAQRAASGLRPVVLWVPDTRQPGFCDELRRQLARVEADADDRETLDFIEAAADWRD